MVALIDVCEGAWVRWRVRFGVSQLWYLKIGTLVSLASVVGDE